MSIDNLMDIEADEKIAAAAFGMPTEGRALTTHGDSRALAGAPMVERIITAQAVAVPRDDSRILQKLKALATAAGDDWFYRFPVRDHGAVKHIEGPTIKAANNVARLYGNCEIDTRVLDSGDSWIIYARFIDWETGFSMTRPFQQQKGQQTIKTKDEGRQLSNALQIGVSKAIRNVICNALEQFTTFAFEEARKNIVEKVGKNLAQYREKVLAALKEMKVDVKRVEAPLGRPAKDWLADDVARVIAEIQAIRDGMATIDETWLPDAPARPTRAQFAGPAQVQEKQAEPPQEFVVVNADHEERTFVEPTDAVKALEDALTDGHARSGRDGADGVWEANGMLLSQLRERGWGERVEALHKLYAELLAKKAAPSTAKETPKDGDKPALAPGAEPPSPMMNRKAEWAPRVAWLKARLQDLPTEGERDAFMQDRSAEFEFIREQRHVDWDGIAGLLDDLRAS